MNSSPYAKRHSGVYESGFLGFKGKWKCCGAEGRDADGCTDMSYHPGTAVMMSSVIYNMMIQREHDHVL